jgi:mono/diheme cytochrome c family protein
LRRRALALGTALLVLGACQPAAAPRAGPEAAAVPSVAAMPRIVETNCAACHDVAGLDQSPYGAAPSFTDIANQQAMTRASLIRFLKDAHNYPDIMDVELNEAEAEAVADYILTLRSDEYRSPY